MSTKVRMPDPQQEIVIQQLTTISTVVADLLGTERMVVAAFTAVGEFLDQKAGQDGESAAVQFEYLGVTFHASCEMPEDGR